MNIQSWYLVQIIFYFVNEVEFIGSTRSTRETDKAATKEQSSGGIDCYVCTSIDNDNPLCRDEFKKNLATSIFISRNCDFDFFKATHCIKLKGTRADGTELLVRQCGDYDWGSHCGDIVYINGERGEERVNGCLETCNHNGCNAAEQIFTISKYICTWIWIVTIYIVWL